MIEKLRESIINEEKIINEIIYYGGRTNSGDAEEAKLSRKHIDSLLKSLKIINKSIPDILGEIDFFNRIGKKKESEIYDINFKGKEKKG